MPLGPVCGGAHERVCVYIPSISLYPLWTTDDAPFSRYNTFEIIVTPKPWTIIS